MTTLDDFYFPLNVIISHLKKIDWFYDVLCVVYMREYAWTTVYDVSNF